MVMILVFMNLIRGHLPSAFSLSFHFVVPVPSNLWLLFMLGRRVPLMLMLSYFLLPLCSLPGGFMPIMLCLMIEILGC
jgi:hypothetical protein